MKTARYIVCLLFSALMLASVTAYSKLPAAEEIVIGDFSEIRDGLPKGWKELDFPRKPRHTEYRVEKDGESYCVKAVSVEAASALYRELGNMDEDLTQYPVLSWSWKVEGVLKNGNEALKEGDDYAARVYVTFEYEPARATYFERIKRRIARTAFGIEPPGNAINYIWANKLKKDASVPNPYTETVMMVAVESGDELAGRWVKEERDIYEDYRRLFKSEPPKITGIVLMTDTDNTKEKAVAYYSGIVLKKRAD